MAKYITEPDVYAPDLSNQTGWCSDTARLVFARWSLRIPVEAPAIPDVIFRDFPPSFQENVRIVSLLRSDFLPECF
jgi:hypothetical protein